MIVICQLNLKGGVGKTTNTIHVGAEFASRGKRVLLIDADPQCDLSFSTGIYESNYDIVDFLNNKSGFKLQMKSQNFFVLPGNEEFDSSNYKRMDLKNAINGKRKNEDGSTFYLKDHFDYVFIDVPPQKISNNYTTSTEMALNSSDYFTTCLYAEPLSVKNLNSFLARVMQLKKDHNNTLKFAGIYFGNVLVTRNDIETYQNDVREVADGLLYKSFIRQDAKVVKACAAGKTIFQFHPSSRAAEDYINLSDELLKSIQNV